MAANPEDTIDPTTHSPRLSALFSYPKHFFTSVLPQQWQNIKDYEYQQKLSELLSNPKFKQGAFITLGIVGILTLPFTLPLLLSAASSVLSLTISAAMFIMRIFMPVMLFNLLNDKLELVNKTHRLIISMLSFINDKISYEEIAKKENWILEKDRTIENLKDIVIVYEEGLPDQRTKLFKNLTKK
jgi:hypothetical protein